MKWCDFAPAMELVAFIMPGILCFYSRWLCLLLLVVYYVAHANGQPRRYKAAREECKECSEAT